MMRITIISGVLLLWALMPAKETYAAASCVTCHSQLEGQLATPAKLFVNDVHAKVGLTCADCHGGDIADNSMTAMSPAKGFRSAPTRAQIPDFCGRCHSNPDYMRRYNPSLQTDQLSQYWTSIHGQRLKKSDTKVATCVDCHSVHNIRAVSDTQSTVYPTNIAGTCAHCHANAAYMKDYGIPTDQYANYSKSVHAQDLASGDLSAPTCSTCHGNHGAAPPGVSSVVNVCGTCHAMNEEDFKNSPHQAAFASMSLPGCVTCHSNHLIEKPLDTWVGVGPKSVCTNCHSAGDKGYQTAQQIGTALTSLNQEKTRASDILANAESSGMEVSDAKAVLTNANDDIIKARVAVHTFNSASVRKLTDDGMGLARKAYQAGAAALRERDFRRKGLAVSLIFILFAIGGLYLKIRQIERRR